MRRVHQFVREFQFVRILQGEQLFTFAHLTFKNHKAVRVHPPPLEVVPDAVEGVHPLARAGGAGVILVT